MSEEILKALMQLFAIIAKQDGGVEDEEQRFVHDFLVQQIADARVKEYYSLFEDHAGLKGQTADLRQNDEIKLTSVVDSVRILGICKKINKTLNQDQKVVVLLRLYELVNADKKFTNQRMEIITTVADVFNIPKNEKNDIEYFVTDNSSHELIEKNLLIINDNGRIPNKFRYLATEKLDGDIIILSVPSVGLYFIKYTGNEDIYLNGLAVSNRRIYLFASGSAVRIPKGKPVYYSDIASHFLLDKTPARISYDVRDVNFIFPDGVPAIRKISFSENQGKLVGIMGASGSGKTTLLNILSGLTRPKSGNILINSINFYEQKDKLHGIIGFIPQDDLLVEELTVFQNLYYNAKLCFRNIPENKINELVDKTLASLGLIDIKYLKVGSVLNKLISGGQRKRLNIALELIREPSILFVDEPTSGLSSRDSENVMDLLRELALKGKLIFVVIHQPSSEIYKMFDRIIILDVGGYLIYYGNPVEAVMYFKRMDAQINSEIGECPACGNVNPELIFNIIESRVIDEFGNYTSERKVSPEAWSKLFEQEQTIIKPLTAAEAPHKNLQIPGWFSQFRIFAVRDFLSKISNHQYVLLTVFEAPVLGFILSYIIRYIADPTSSVYIFRENENIPIYIFMSLIVALFLGLTVSAEEIFRDRKILKRESFLNLSKSSYLMSKIIILLFISAIQTLLFVLIGNSILGIKGMTFAYWFALFTTAACANLIGLNVSASFNSAITIYIIIPLIIIPMMVLSGAMFSFDKLNRTIGSVGKVPWIAEIMPTKWSYEALMVHQFKANRFQRPFYRVKKDESIADFKQVYLLPELNKRLELVFKEFQSTGQIKNTADDLKLIKNELGKENVLAPNIAFEQINDLIPEKASAELFDQLRLHLAKLDDYYSREFVMATTQLENMIMSYMEEKPGMYNRNKDLYHNESVEEYVRKVFEKNKMVEHNNELIQQIDPIYKDPFPGNWFSFRSHFFAPRKYFLGSYFDTYFFNIGFIWFLTIVFYITLYFDLLKKLMRWPGLYRRGFVNNL
jgi:ABC-type multidrug transport system ATPase subunit/ABC-type multidrug transport system permease subunit